MTTKEEKLLKIPYLMYNIPILDTSSVKLMEMGGHRKKILGEILILKYKCLAKYM